jgi:hypothetical protein
VGKLGRQQLCTVLLVGDFQNGRRHLISERWVHTRAPARR